MSTSFSLALKCQCVTAHKVSAVCSCSSASALDKCPLMQAGWRGEKTIEIPKGCCRLTVRSSPEDIQNIPGLIWDGGWASRLCSHLLWYRVTSDVPMDGILHVPEIWPALLPPQPAIVLSILGTPPRASLGCGHPCRQSPGQLRMSM